ncbi:MAG: TIGR02147 family protein, partial [Fibrobacter sp.]|nr:TIGR02147 family protein [Fibrobacter sp.]
MNSIFTYTDYREYLNDFLREKRKKNPRYSSRCAAEKCGVPSGTFTRIINGTRSIGPSLLPKFSEWLGLKQRESNYFKLLVKFNNCSSTADRNKYFAELQAARAQVKHLVPENQFHFFEQWYFVALYELVKVFPNVSNPLQIGEKLEPPISESKTKKALEILEKAGFIEKTENGYRQCSSFLSTGDTWESAAIHAFQRTMTVLGSESLDRFRKPDRDISTLSVSLSIDG